MTVRASTHEELDPLLDFCRRGMLFDVQRWIAAGRPVGMPEHSTARSVKRNPLRVAIDAGFHSLVQVLLEAGAPISDGRYYALAHAVEEKRADLAALLIEQGADVKRVPMRSVIEMWGGEMVDLFVMHGASLLEGKPVAWGLMNNIRPALGLLKKYGDEIPQLQDQANMALRYHAYEGSERWVGLMLWAGADPWARGPDRLEDCDDEEDDEDYGYLNAVELAVLHGHLDILRHKQVRTSLPTLEGPEALRLIEEACRAPDGKPLERLLEVGYDIATLPERASAAIVSLVHSMSWGVLASPLPWSDARTKNKIDTSRARERMKMIHMLVARGAKWAPADKAAIGDLRRCLLKMAPDYVMEFVWLMHFYRAARRSDVKELLRTESMVRLLAGEKDRVAELVDGIPEHIETPSSAATG